MRTVSSSGLKKKSGSMAGRPTFSWRNRPEKHNFRDLEINLRCSGLNYPMSLHFHLIYSKKKWVVQFLPSESVLSCTASAVFYFILFFLIRSSLEPRPSMKTSQPFAQSFPHSLTGRVITRCLVQVNEPTLERIIVLDIFQYMGILLGDVVVSTRASYRSCCEMYFPDWGFSKRPNHGIFHELSEHIISTWC